MDIKSRKLWIFLILSIVGSIIWKYSDASIFNDWVNFIKWMVGEHATKAMKKE